MADTKYDESKHKRDEVGRFAKKEKQRERIRQGKGDDMVKNLRKRLKESGGELTDAERKRVRERRQMVEGVEERTEIRKALNEGKSRKEILGEMGEDATEAEKQALRDRIRRVSTRRSLRKSDDMEKAAKDKIKKVRDSDRSPQQVRDRVAEIRKAIEQIKERRKKMAAARRRGLL